MRIDSDKSQPFEQPTCIVCPAKHLIESIIVNNDFSNCQTFFVRKRTIGSYIATFLLGPKTVIQHNIGTLARKNRAGKILGIKLAPNLFASRILRVTFCNGELMFLPLMN